jgi:hypothetical protein
MDKNNFKSQPKLVGNVAQNFLAKRGIVRRDSTFKPAGPVLSGSPNGLDLRKSPFMCLQFMISNRRFSDTIIFELANSLVTPAMTSRAVSGADVYRTYNTVPGTPTVCLLPEAVRARLQINSIVYAFHDKGQTVALCPVGINSAISGMGDLITRERLLASRAQVFQSFAKLISLYEQGRMDKEVYYDIVITNPPAPKDNSAVLIRTRI